VEPPVAQPGDVTPKNVAVVSFWSAKRIRAKAEKVHNYPDWV